MFLRMLRLLPLCFLLHSASAQPTLTSISGTVLDPAGAPIPNATVTATSPTGAVTETRTDPEGKFLLRNLTPGEYKIRVTYAGFKTLTKTVTATPDQPSAMSRPSPHTLTLQLPEMEQGIPISSTGGGKQDPGNALVKVHYATDRKPSGNSDPYLFYTGLRNDEPTLAYGTATVSIPKDHRFGELEEPSLFRLEFRPDKDKHVVLKKVIPASEQAFFNSLSKDVRATRRKEALIFIHGYRNSFDYAARRTAQIAYDLNFDGVPILYSWPSEDSTLNYKVDESNVEWTTPRLEAFLSKIASNSGAERIYLIAHSMGNRALTRALTNLAARQQTWLRDKFRELILAAPDIDAGVFRDLAAEFNKVAGRTTLYSSSKDKALRASQSLSRYIRAGQTGRHLQVLPGIETIDVSAVDTSFLGHSYIGDNRSVLSDLYRLITTGRPARTRCGLSQHSAPSGPYWKFRPDLATRCAIAH